jgi:hypothetical protein
MILGINTAGSPILSILVIALQSFLKSHISYPVVTPSDTFSISSSKSFICKHLPPLPRIELSWYSIFLITVNTFFGDIFAAHSILSPTALLNLLGKNNVAVSCMLDEHVPVKSSNEVLERSPHLQGHLEDNFPWP